MSVQMSFDFEGAMPVTALPPTVSAQVRSAKSQQGAVAYQAGRSAELRIAQDYERRGFAVARHRWRGKHGEIDLILQDGDGLVFVEVKKSKTFEGAAQRLGQRQIRRLFASAEEFLGTQPLGSLTDIRFDVAIVDGVGDVQVIENAFSH